jgi:hypothetical protein
MDAGQACAILVETVHSREEPIRTGKSLFQPFRLPSRRHAFLLFVATAFLVQSYVAQTHIHVLHPSSTTSSVDADSGSGPAKAKSDRRPPSRDHLPANDDPAKCPLCRAFGHAGQFVWPAAAVFILPQIPVAIIPVAAALGRTTEPASHNWQGRAPPRV